MFRIPTGVSRSNHHAIQHFLAIAIALIVLMAWPLGGQHALAGDTCADLEERVAELEATTARKGNRQVSLKVSGVRGELYQYIWGDDDSGCADLEERVAELEATTARKGNRRISLEVGGDVKIVDTNVHVDEARGFNGRFDDFSSQSASDTFFGFGGDIRLNVDVGPRTRVFGFGWNMAGDTQTMLPPVVHRAGETFDSTIKFTPNVFTTGLGAEWDFPPLLPPGNVTVVPSFGVYGGIRLGELETTQTIVSGGRTASFNKTDTTVSPVAGAEGTLRFFFPNSPIYGIGRLGVQQTLGDEVNSTLDLGNTTSQVTFDTDQSTHYYGWFGIGIPISWLHPAEIDVGGSDIRF